MTDGRTSVRRRGARRWWWIVLFAPVLCVGAAGCAQPAIHLPAGRDRVEVPLERAGDCLFTRAAVNGEEPRLFLIDTGAAGNIVAEPLAKLLRLPWIWEIKAGGVGGKTKMPVRAVRSIHVGDAVLDGHWLGELDFAGINRAFGAEIEGALGYSTFYDLPVTLDHRTPSIIFHHRDRFQPPAGAAEVPMRLMDDQPHVKGVINREHEGWFLLDTACDFRLGLQNPFAKRHPELLARDDRASFPVAGVGGTEMRRHGQVASFRILGHEFLNVPVQLPADKKQDNPDKKPGAPEGTPAGLEPADKKPDNPEDTLGTVGAPLLRNFRLTFDYRRERLWVEWNPPETLQEKIARGADLDAQDLRGWTLLHDCVHEDDAEGVRALISAGADVNVANRDGDTPLIGAAHRGHQEVVRMLLDGGTDVQAANKWGTTALMAAASRGHQEIARMLLDGGADVRPANTHGTTALMAAAQKGDEIIVRALLDAGADVDVHEVNGKTALLTAAFFGHDQVVEHLLAAGASVDAADKDGVTPLMAAAYSGHTNIVESLLRHGAAVDARHSEGVTALYLAAQEGHTEVLHALLAAGADPYLKDKEGHTARYCAEKNGHREIAGILKDHERRERTP